MSWRAHNCELASASAQQLVAAAPAPSPACCKTPPTGARVARRIRRAPRIRRRAPRVRSRPAARSHLQQDELLELRHLAQLVAAQVEPSQPVHREVDPSAAVQHVAAGNQRLQRYEAVQLGERLQLVVREVDVLQRGLLELREQRE
eukprot:6608889-Prymnesium_polylepis.1